MENTYRATVLTGKGGPEMLQVQELPLPEPGPGEIRDRSVKIYQNCSNCSAKAKSIRRLPRGCRCSKPAAGMNCWGRVDWKERLSSWRRAVKLPQRLSNLKAIFRPIPCPLTRPTHNKVIGSR